MWEGIEKPVLLNNSLQIKISLNSLQGSQLSFYSPFEIAQSQQDESFKAFPRCALRVPLPPRCYLIKFRPKSFPVVKTSASVLPSDGWIAAKSITTAIASFVITVICPRTAEIDTSPSISLILDEELLAHRLVYTRNRGQKSHRITPSS